MKKLLIMLLIGIIAVCLIACDGNGASSATTSSKLVGTWKATKASAGLIITETITFNASGSLFVEFVHNDTLDDDNDYSYTASGTWLESNGYLTMDYDVSDFPSEYSGSSATDYLYMLIEDVNTNTKTISTKEFDGNSFTIVRYYGESSIDGNEYTHYNYNDYFTEEIVFTVGTTVLTVETNETGTTADYKTYSKQTWSIDTEGAGTDYTYRLWNDHAVSYRASGSYTLSNNGNTMIPSVSDVPYIRQ